MLPSSSAATSSLLLLVEAALTAVAVAISFLLPKLASPWFATVERLFARLARRPILSVVAVGFSALVLRLAILPVFPVPPPHTPDDFSFLLAADTFAHGRLANPTPAMWTHLETMEVTMRPTYTSMYFPGYGLALAAAQVLFGNPWIAALLIDVLMCAALCWMLQGWLPPGWALLGGMLAVLRLGLFNYMINRISGGAGLLAALAGALVLGALPRLLKTARLRYGVLMALGIAVLALTRPYEGVLLCLPVAVVLLHWVSKGNNRPRPAVLLRRAALPAALLVAALAWLGYYDYRAFGNPTTLPYTVDRAQYGIAPYFIWQSPRPTPQYRHPLMRSFYVKTELVEYSKVHSLAGFFPETVDKVLLDFLFFAGFALLPPLVMARRVLLDRRTRLLVIAVAILAAGELIEIFSFPHYVAPFVAAFYALGLQAMRHLRVWRPGGAPVGKTIVRLIVALCIPLAALRIAVTPRPPAIVLADPLPASAPPGFQRAQIKARLEHLTGKQIVFLRFAPTHDPLDGWVYNRADIAASKIVWAWDMGPAANQQFLRAYPGRTAWLVNPDTSPPTVIPYPDLAQSSAENRRPPVSRSQTP